MSTQKPPRDPNVTTQLDSDEPPQAKPQAVKPPPKKRKPKSVFGLPKS